ncbi:SDR family NAD(P)-dependent oxidoreductase [Roseateles chitinivorans]|uniref:SDR family NAD(P)-dependent oxidoreductase n=1 Tax=Roseateles chitinivorans TaxID=2917965 RepID=UPI003D676F59
MTPTTLIIAGFAPGLGAALKLRFERAGYDVLGISRSSDPPWNTDLQDPAATARLFERIDRDMPPLAGVIHTAMHFLRKPFLQTEPEAFQAVWQSMVMTAVNVSQQAIPRLKAQGGGALIFSGASGSRRAGPNFSAFSSAKFALRGLSQALAREHGSEGIHVAHVVIDGLVRGERTAQRFGPVDDEQLIAPADLAEQYWHLFHQPRSAWTHELDVRPSGARA